MNQRSSRSHTIFRMVRSIEKCLESDLKEQYTIFGNWIIYNDTILKFFNLRVWR